MLKYDVIQCVVQVKSIKPKQNNIYKSIFLNKKMFNINIVDASEKF